MGKRFLWLWLLPLSFGCTILTPPPGEFPAAKPQAADLGDPLQLAAECLERGDDAAALPLLARYVEAHPDHPAIRVHLADVMYRLGQLSAARREFEQAVSDAQEQSEDRYLIHAHTRLVDIATAQSDEFHERLHRGIALFLLARQVRAKSEDGAPDPEQLLFKAAAELKTAARLRPTSTQVHWYAYEVWTYLGQTQPARTSLRRARDCAAISDLTPAEREEMATACDGEFAVTK